MNTNKLRQTFLDYFAKKGHTVVASSSLIPGNDPTLLFTNAGMVQFKEVFLGQEKRPYVRAASAQACLRAGGKHNDLENVGYTARHHTFFEMLGNFSFGDYFKQQAIEYAWDFLTNELKIPKEKLWVTVYKDDDEAEEIWKKHTSVDHKRISRCDEDNFWSMGDTGPCGPCTEIFYDHGDSIPGGPPGTPEGDGDRYIEIWNLVFMQYNRSADGTLTPLPKPSVDTGAGIERLAAVMQNVHNNYDIDLFVHLINAIKKITGNIQNGETSMRVIADHLRSTSFLIADGVVPSNEGRGYVLRRIIRRAARHGNKLGLKKPFFYQLVKDLATVMGEAYPQLVKQEQNISDVLLREEQQFAKTLEAGLNVLEIELHFNDKNISREEFTKGMDKEYGDKILQYKNAKIIPGGIVFKLYDTYGFPSDLTADFARERGLMIDEEGFKEEMLKQKRRSKAASGFAHDYNAQLKVQGETNFTGHHKTSDKGTVTELFDEKNQLVDQLKTGQHGIVVLDTTPFYAEAGGQVGDTGIIQFDGGVFQVQDTKKQSSVHLHYGVVEQGSLKVGVTVDAEVDVSRAATMLNHTATHLLHAALRRVVGSHVIQKGSLVAPDRLRFDFAHHAPLTKHEIREIERLVNQQIRANLSAQTEIVTQEEAIKKGAMALFGEKYGEKVRVLSIGEFSMELCGGTHVDNTGSIGSFKIISEVGIAAGIRRIEALTADAVFDWIEKEEQQFDDIAARLKTDRASLSDKVDQLLAQMKKQEKELAALQQNRLGILCDELVGQAKSINNIPVIASEIKDITSDDMRNLVDRLKDKLRTGIIFLAMIDEGKCRFIAGVTKDQTKDFSAGDLIKHVSQIVGGKGGGRPDMAQGGCDDVTQIHKALEAVHPWVSQ